jgi:hypothetical protein
MKRGNILTDTAYLFRPSIPKNILISFIGVIDSNAETYLIQQVEEYLDSIKCRENIKMKVLEITIELLQNILHHSPVQPIADPHDSFQLEKGEKGFIISTFNFIENRKVAALAKRIEYLNSLSNLELTSLYRDILKNGNQERETAGLGLIDIRRKSGKPILFMFAPPSTLNNKFSLFTVKVLV